MTKERTHLDIRKKVIKILGDDSEVERIYKIIEKKEKLQYSK